MPNFQHAIKQLLDSDDNIYKDRNSGYTIIKVKKAEMDLPHQAAAAEPSTRFTTRFYAFENDKPLQADGHNDIFSLKLVDPKTGESSEENSSCKIFRFPLDNGIQHRYYLLNEAEEPLGKGSFGSVFPVTKIPYTGISEVNTQAVKKIHIHGITNDEIHSAMNNAKRESELFQKFYTAEEPVRLIVKETEQYCYIVMQRLPGKNLRQIKKAKQLTLANRVIIISELAVTLDRFLCCNPPCIHGDLKPENIMVDLKTSDHELEKTSVYLVDLNNLIKLENANGIAEFERLDISEYGTEEYMAPESDGFDSSKEKVRFSAKSNTWTLGTIALELLAPNPKTTSPVKRSASTNNIGILRNKLSSSIRRHPSTSCVKSRQKRTNIFTSLANEFPAQAKSYIAPLNKITLQYIRRMHDLSYDYRPDFKENTKYFTILKDLVLYLLLNETYDEKKINFYFTHLILLAKNLWQPENNHLLEEYFGEEDSAPVLKLLIKILKAGKLNKKYIPKKAEEYSLLLQAITADFIQHINKHESTNENNTHRPCFNEILKFFSILQQINQFFLASENEKNHEDNAPLLFGNLILHAKKWCREEDFLAKENFFRDNNKKNVLICKLLISSYKENELLKEDNLDRFPILHKLTRDFFNHTLIQKISAEEIQEFFTQLGILAKLVQSTANSSRSEQNKLVCLIKLILLVKGLWYAPLPGQHLVQKTFSQKIAEIEIGNSDNNETYDLFIKIYEHDKLDKNSAYETLSLIDEKLRFNNIIADYLSNKSNNLQRQSIADLIELPIYLSENIACLQKNLVCKLSKKANSIINDSLLSELIHNPRKIWDINGKTVYRVLNFATENKKSLDAYFGENKVSILISNIKQGDSLPARIQWLPRDVVYLLLAAEDENTRNKILAKCRPKLKVAVYKYLCDHEKSLKKELDTRTSAVDSDNEYTQVKIILKNSLTSQLSLYKAKKENERDSFTEGTAYRSGFFSRLLKRWLNINIGFESGIKISASAYLLNAFTNDDFNGLSEEIKKDPRLLNALNQGELGRIASPLLSYARDATKQQAPTPTDLPNARPAIRLVAVR